MKAMKQSFSLVFNISVSKEFEEKLKSSSRYVMLSKLFEVFQNFQKFSKFVRMFQNLILETRIIQSQQFQSYWNHHWTKHEVFLKIFLQYKWSNPQFPADLVTFKEEIFNGQLHFSCSASSESTDKTALINLLKLYSL